MMSIANCFNCSTAIDTDNDTTCYDGFLDREICSGCRENYEDAKLQFTIQLHPSDYGIIENCKYELEFLGRLDRPTKAILKPWFIKHCNGRVYLRWVLTWYKPRLCFELKEDKILFLLKFGDGTNL